MLATANLTESVTGELINKEMRSLFKEWGLTKVTYTVVSDQGSNILRAGRIGSWHHYNCFAHKLNLCLTTNGVNVSKRFPEVLKKCTDVVKTFRYKTAQVKRKQKELMSFMDQVVNDDHTYGNLTVEIATTSIKSDNATRWSSLFTMIDSILKNRVVITDLLREWEKHDQILAAKDIKLLELLLVFLKPFKTMTVSMQADTYPTLSQVWPAVCSLKKKCQPVVRSEVDIGMDANSDSEDPYDFDDENHKSMEDLKKCVLKALDERFPLDKIQLLATCLDPRFRTFTDHFKTVEEYEEAINLFLTAIKDDLANYVVQSKPVETSQKQQSAFNEMFADVLDKVPVTQLDSALKTEIRQYLALPFLESVIRESLNLLNWWREHEQTFPILSKIAKKIHSIVATSAPSERIFSKAGNIVNEKRSRLTPANVNNFVLLHTNLYKAEEKSIVDAMQQVSLSSNQV